MAKSINWVDIAPYSLRSEILTEPEGVTFLALRLGSLYFDPPFWPAGETVTIRANHKILRNATIVGSLKMCRLAALTADDFAKLKKPFQSLEKLQAYLSTAYQQPVTPETEVTVVYYQNHPVQSEQVEPE